MIPPFQELMLPVVERASDGESIANRTLINELAERFSLSESDRKEMLANGQSRFDNRVYWALVYLRRGGLMESTGRGLNRITQRGKDVLATKPPRIDIKLLSRFPEFREFRKSKATPAAVATSENEESFSPAERIETAFAELRDSLISDLLVKLHDVEPFRFEKIVLEVLVAMKYGGSFKEAAAVTQKIGDEGIDGVIKQDPLGLDVVYIQAKRWKGNVGRQEIQGFVGALAGKKANKGVFITTSGFNDNAIAYAAGLQQKVILIDGRKLAELMIDHGIGVTEGDAYIVKKIDSDYFEEA